MIMFIISENHYSFNIFNMHLQHLPPITSRVLFLEMEEAPITRKRNHSLNYNPEHTHLSPPSQEHTHKHKKEPLYSSRKNQILSKQFKFKNNKNYTKRCQENMNQFISLRSRVLQLQPTDLNSEPTHHISGHNLQRCSGKKEGLKIRNKLEGTQQPERCRTEEGEQTNHMLRGHRTQKLLFNSNSKKYKEMSLEQITGGDHNNGKLLDKLRQFRSNFSEKIKLPRKKSEDYELQGW